jgi:hypothetical protein
MSVWIGYMNLAALFDNLYKRKINYCGTAQCNRKNISCESWPEDLKAVFGRTHERSCSDQL